MITENDSKVALAIPEAPPDIGSPAPVVRRSRRPFLLAGLAVLAILLLAGGVLANSALSQAYSARKAVQDYFAAAAQRDVDGMLSNATFLRGEGSYGYFFGKDALQAMLKLPANSDIHDVRITSERTIDSSSRAISVAMTWNGKERSETLTVRKDPARTNWLLYPSWRVEIPSTLIQVKLPNQAGSIELDGRLTPTGSSQTAIQAIGGYHRVTMLSTALWNETSQSVDAVDGSGTVTVSATISQSAVAQAKTEIMSNFNSCDAAKYDDCFNHTYSVPGTLFISYFPGYGNIVYTTYLNKLNGDPTASVTLTVQADTGKVAVAGACAETVIVDGSRRYNLKGDYSGTVTWDGANASSSDLTWDCGKAKG